MESVRIEVEQREIRTEVYACSSEARPGILFLHELFGLRDYIREDAQALAERGYLVYVPDLFSGGTLRYCIRAMVRGAARRNEGTSDVNREIHVLLDTLKADPRCDGRLGMVGMCLSGGFVIQMARRPDMAAPVLYHHSLGQEGAGVPDDEPLDDVVRLQAHFARRDVFCPPRRRRRLEERLEGRIDAFTYDLPHGFRSVARSTEGAALAWERTLRFFDEHLRT